jgi:hypothetical protein
MLKFGRLAILAVAALVVEGALASVSVAAPPPRYVPPPVTFAPRTFSGPLVNPNYQIAPGLSVNQYAYNLSVIGRAYSRVPPYALGYNPYMSNYVGYSPYLGYTPAYSSYTVPSFYYNPYTLGVYSPLTYSAYYNPYGMFLP